MTENLTPAQRWERLTFADDYIFCRTPLKKGPTEKHTIFQQKIKKKTNLLCKNP